MSSSDKGTADACRAPGWIWSSLSRAEGPAEEAASVDGSSVGTDEEDEAHFGQACSISGYGEWFLHDKHTARTCGVRSSECASIPSVPAEFQDEACPCSITTKKIKSCPRSAVRGTFPANVISNSCRISASCFACRKINR